MAGNVAEIIRSPTETDVVGSFVTFYADLSGTALKVNLAAAEPDPSPDAGSETPKCDPPKTP